jgi:5-methylcytosine-specific restriction endonuclease McrA
MADVNSTPDTPEIPQKQCTKCKETFPATKDYFYSHVKAKDGLNNECRPCALERRHEYVAKNREQVNARGRARYKENPEPIKAKRREYVAEHHEEVKAQKRAHHAANAEQINAKRHADYVANPEPKKAYGRIYYATNAERLRAEKRARRANNPEKVTAQQHAYYRAHPEQTSAANARRRARLAQAAINDLTHAQWVAIQEAYDHRCVYCGKRRKGKLTQDHIIPISKGGNHTYSNVVPACRSCNCRKHDGPVLAPVQPLLLL